MNWISANTVMIALVISPVALSQQGDSETTTLVDPNWGGYPAYYQPSPLGHSLRLLAAIYHFCRTVDESRQYSDVDLAFIEKSYWTCETDDFSYLQAVSGMGEKSVWGLVCEGPIGIPGQQFFAGEMLEKFANCLIVDREEGSDNLVIVLPSNR